VRVTLLYGLQDYTSLKDRGETIKLDFVILSDIGVLISPPSSPKIKGMRQRYILVAFSWYLKLLFHGSLGPPINEVMTHA